MSAPDTEIERQTRRHRFPLAVIAAVIFTAFVVLVVVVGAVMDESESSADAPDVNPVERTAPAPDAAEG